MKKISGYVKKNYSAGISIYFWKNKIPINSSVFDSKNNEYIITSYSNGGYINCLNTKTKEINQFSPNLLFIK